MASKSDEKGFSFEYLISGLFQKQGYLARRGAPLQYGNNKTDVTDIDVLGIKFNQLFQRQIAICDCKNKVKSKPYERIFWASGLGKFVKAEEVFVALPKTQNEIIEFAHSGGVRILTNEFIKKYYNKSEAKGLSDYNYYNNIEKEIEVISKNNPSIQEMLLVTRKQFLNLNPYLGVNIAMEKLMLISKGLKFRDSHPREHKVALTYLICQYTVLICINLLAICGDLLVLPDSVRKKRLVDKLTFGELEPNVVQKIIEDTKNLTVEIFNSSIDSNLLPKQIDIGEIEPPEYLESLYGLINRAILNPSMYVSLPNIMDFILFEKEFKDLSLSDEEIGDILGYYNITEKIKASKNIQKFISEYCDIDWDIIFQDLK